MNLAVENIRLAIASLTANKMRAVLTMLGIIIGIAAVIAIMTLGNAVTNSINDSMQSLGANNVNVGLSQRSQEQEVDEDGAAYGTVDTASHALEEDDCFTRDMISALCERYPDEISAISVSESAGTGQVEDGDLYANITLTGVSGGFFAANDITMLSGRQFNAGELEEGHPVAMVSDKLVNNLFGGSNAAALGKTITAQVGDKYGTYTIVGVYEYQQNMMMGLGSTEKDTRTNLYVPLQQTQTLTGNDNYSSFAIVVKDGVDSDRFAAQVKQFLNVYYQDNPYFEVSAFSMESLVSAFSGMLDTVTMAITVIAGIALLVGGIGVMNIMLVSITERTREIGTRKALGASNNSIRFQFIVEAIILCLLGGAIGIVLGIIAGMAGAKILGYPAAPSVSSIIFSLVFSMAIGVFFGYYPANKAAKMNPIDALRYE